MTEPAYDPAKIFVRGGGLTEGIEWGYWLAVTVFWVVELELSALQLVLMGTVLELSVLLAETPTGVVADLVSRKRSLMIAQVVMGIGFIWSVVSTNYWVILPAQVLFGVGWTFRSGADTAWVTDELKGMGEVDDDDIEQLLLRKHRFGIVMAIVFLLVIMVIGTLTTVRWAAVAGGVLQIAVAIYFRLYMREDHFTPGRETEATFMQTLQRGLGVVRGSKRLRTLVVVVLLIDFGSEAFDRLGHKHFLDTAAFDDASLLGLGALFLALALAGLVANHLAGSALKNKRGVARVAVLLLVVAGLGGLLAAITNIVIVIAIGFMLQDSTREALWPVLEGWANRDAPSDVRATIHSLMGQTTALGELAGGLTLGVVAEATSIEVTLIIAAVGWLLAGVIATRGIERQPASVN